MESMHGELQRNPVVDSLLGQMLGTMVVFIKDRSTLYTVCIVVKWESDVETDTSLGKF